MQTHKSKRSPRGVARKVTVGLLLAGTLVGTSGCNVALGAGAVAVIAGVAIIGYGCGEPVDVTVWDHQSTHPVCDATVTAEQNGSVHEFSPCYRLHLGDGAWVIKATKPGYGTAIGSVTVNPKRRCSEPTFHSVELTLPPAGTQSVLAAPEPVTSASAPAPVTPVPTAPSSAPVVPAPATGSSSSAPAPSAAPVTPVPPAPPAP